MHIEKCNFVLCIKWVDVSVGIKSYEEARRFFLIKTEPIQTASSGKFKNT